MSQLLPQQWVTFTCNLKYQNNSSGVPKKVLVPPKGWDKFTLDTPLETRFKKSHNGHCVQTGPNSGLFIVDIDNESQWQSFLTETNQHEPFTVSVRTGSGGKHLYFQYTPDLAGIKTSSKMITHNGQKIDIDVRSDGGMVIAPPTKVQGHSYTWINSPDTTPLARVPDWLISSLRSGHGTSEADTPLEITNVEHHVDPNLTKSEFPMFKSLQDFIFQKCRIVGSKLDKLVFFTDSETFNVQTTEKTCIFTQAEHSSNHQYLVIQKNGKMVQRCHSKKTSCAGKESEPWILPEDILKELHSLINLSEPVSKELIELAKAEAKSMVNDYFEGNENMQMVVRDDQTISGQLTNFHSMRKCPMCNIGDLLTTTRPQGWYVHCEKCHFRFPTEPGSYLPIGTKFGNLQQYMALVFNIGSINFYNGTGSDELTIGWNEFIEDNIQVVDDHLLNDTLVKALSGTHSRLADLLYAIFGQHTVHCRDLKNPWYVFENQIWRNDDDVLIHRQLKSQDFSTLLVKAKYVYKASNASNKEKKLTQIQRVISSLESNAMQNAIIEQYAVLCRRRNEDFLDLLDFKRNLLAFTNGVYDLDAGIFRSGKPDDYITMTVGYEYDLEKMNDEEKIQEFNRFFFQVFPDDEVARYMIKFLGSCLAGYTRDQIFTFGHGTGSNGKGVLINLMAKVLGQFTAKIDASFLCGGMPDPDKPTPTITRLIAKRFVYISEVVDSAKLNEQLFKALCGEERMPYRPLYGEQREFLPDFKMFMVCNSLPSFNGGDYAMKRRIRVIPFESSFKESSEHPDPERNEFIKDPTINDKLDSWKYVVMKLLIQAYDLYKSEGLSNVPEKMQLTTQAYVNDNNALEAFLGECCVFGSDQRIQLTHLYDEFDKWCLKNGMEGIKTIKDGRSIYQKNLKERFKSCLGTRARDTSTGGTKVWIGVSLKEEA